MSGGHRLQSKRRCFTVPSKEFVLRASFDDEMALSFVVIWNSETPEEANLPSSSSRSMLLEHLWGIVDVEDGPDC